MTDPGDPAEEALARVQIQSLRSLPDPAPETHGLDARWGAVDAIRPAGGPARR